MYCRRWKSLKQYVFTVNNWVVHESNFLYDPADCSSLYRPHINSASGEERTCTKKVTQHLKLPIIIFILNWARVWQWKKLICTCNCHLKHNQQCQTRKYYHSEIQDKKSCLLFSIHFSLYTWSKEKSFLYTKIFFFFIYLFIYLFFCSF